MATTATSASTSTSSSTSTNASTTRQRSGSGSKSSSRSTPPLVPVGSNLVVLRGHLRRDPEFRVLASGDEMFSVDLVVHDEELPMETVPVVWLNPQAAAVKFGEGDDVVVIGRVRRRFFRAGGTTATRTEVHADSVLSARSGVRIRSALEPRLDDLNL